MPLRSERRFISMNNIQPGMLIQFTYRKKSGGTGQYVVLVVDPKKQNEHASEPQLHGFIVDDMTDSELIDFFANVGSSISISYDDRTKSVVEGLNTDEAYEKFKSSRFVKNRSYRTFNISGIAQARQILIGSVD